MNKELEEDKKQINKMLDNIYDGLEFEDDEDIRELYLKQKHALKTALNHIDNSISKELIEEKIEELNEDIEDYLKTDKSGRFTRTNCIFTYKKEALQELLEGK